MKIYIHYLPRISKAPVRLFNVESVHDAGEGQIRVKMQFSDAQVVHHMVARVVVEPEAE